MRFANEHIANTNFIEVIAQSWFANAQGHTVVRRTVAAHVAACVGAHARWAADCGLHVGFGEANTLACQPIDVWGFQMGMAVTAEIVPAQLIAHDEQHVFHGALR